MAKHKPFTLRIRAELFTQLAQMETAGLPTDRALSVLRVPAPGAARLVAMQKLLPRFEFAIAGEVSGLFTPLEAKLIRASMMAGSPARIYRRLGDFYTERAIQVATMRSRMAVPALIFLLALAIQPLPSLVLGTIGVFGYLWRVMMPVLMIAGLIFAVKWWLTKPDPSGASRESPWLKLPLVGKLIIRQNVRDFFESLALMLEAGVSMLDALPMALDTIADASIKREFKHVAPRVAAGQPLSQAIADSRYLGDAISRERVVAYIHTGEASGTLPDMLMRHTTLETQAINGWYEQLATWAPRIVYGMVVVWMAISLLSGPGFGPRVPTDL